MKLNKRKMEKQFQKEGTLPPVGVQRSRTGQRLRDFGSLIYPEHKGQKSAYGAVRATYGFIDDIEGDGRRRRRRRAFGNVGNRSLFEGGFF